MMVLAGKIDSGVTTDFRKARRVAAYDRSPAGHRFQYREPEALIDRRHYNQGCGSVQAGHVFIRDAAGQQHAAAQTQGCNGLENLLCSLYRPILCAGLLFGSAIKHSTSLARDYGTNLLGAMVGGVAEYLSLMTGFRFLLLVVAVFYIAAVLTRRQAAAAPAPAGIK